MIYVTCLALKGREYTLKVNWEVFIVNMKQPTQVLLTLTFLNTNDMYKYAASHSSAESVPDNSNTYMHYVTRFPVNQER